MINAIPMKFSAKNFGDTDKIIPNLYGKAENQHS